MKNFSLIIPVYNEALNIEVLVNEIHKYLKDSQFNYEIIIVNDGSNDNSNIILAKIQKLNNLVKIINNPKNIGQSYSLIKGIKHSNYNNIVTLDGDGQNNPRDILNLLSVFLKNTNFKLVGGIRKKRKDKFIKKISSRLANSIRKFILSDNCIDTGCSLKVFDKKIFLSFPAFDGIHRFLPALYSGYGHKTTFVNVDHRERKYGISKYGTLKRLIKGIRDIFIVIKIIKKYKEKNND